MTQQEDRARTRRARIERLRGRLSELDWNSDGERVLLGVIKGILDMLEDDEE